MTSKQTINELFNNYVTLKLPFLNHPPPHHHALSCLLTRPTCVASRIQQTPPKHNGPDAK